MTNLEPARRTTSLPPNLFGTLDRAVAEARAAGIDVIDVSKGSPDHPTPAHIIQAMQDAVADPRNHSYNPHAPRPHLAEAIALRYREDHGVTLDPEHEVAIAHGSHEALMAAVLSHTNPGETIVAPDPGYPAYLSAARQADATLRTVPLRREHGYQPDFSDIADVAAASVLLLNFPHNPTGAVATPATYARAVAESARLGAAYVNDFAYSSLGFSARPLSALTVDRSRTIEVSTLSKTYSMAGWRLGYAVGNADLIATLRRFQTHAYSTVFGAVQDAATAALGGDQQAANDLVDLYRRRRDLVVSGLQAQGWDVDFPPGTFFAWVGLDGADDRVFAERLLREHGVAVAPGSGFGSRGAGFVRIGLVLPDDRLAELITRFGAARALITTGETHG